MMDYTNMTREDLLRELVGKSGIIDPALNPRNVGRRSLVDIDNLPATPADAFPIMDAEIQAKVTTNGPEAFKSSSELGSVIDAISSFTPTEINAPSLPQPNAKMQVPYGNEQAQNSYASSAANNGLLEMLQRAQTMMG